MPFSRRTSNGSASYVLVAALALGAAGCAGAPVVVAGLPVDDEHPSDPERLREWEAMYGSVVEMDEREPVAEDEWPRAEDEIHASNVLRKTGLVFAFPFALAGDLAVYYWEGAFSTWKGRAGTVDLPGGRSKEGRLVLTGGVIDAWDPAEEPAPAPGAKTPR